jgi:hypothetical protein
MLVRHIFIEIVEACLHCLGFSCIPLFLMKLSDSKNSNHDVNTTEHCILENQLRPEAVERNLTADFTNNFLSFLDLMKYAHEVKF